MSGFGNDSIISKNKLLKGVWNFKLQKKWSIDSANSLPFVDVTSIRVDEAGKIYCVDRNFGIILVLNSEGKFLYKIGKKGEGPGEYKSVFNIHLRNNKIIVPDQGKFHFFRMDGKYLDSESSMIGFVFPIDFIDQFTNEKKGSQFFLYSG